MAPTDYRVATAEELLGAKPPRRREASYLYWARMGRIDQASRNKFEVKRRENVKKRADRRSAVVEPSAQVKALKSEEALLPRRAYRDHLMTRIDTSNSPSPPKSSSSSPSSGVSRHGSKNSRDDLQIIFTPVDIRKSTISFTDPIHDPEERLLTPTQERYNDERRWTDAANQQSTTRRESDEPTEPASEKLMLEPEHIGRLVSALAECPLLRVHVSRQWWNANVSDAASLLQHFNSQANQTCLSEQRSPSIRQEILEEEFARNFPDHPKARRAPEPARTKLGGIALVDPKVHGTPIRFISRDYQLGTSTVKVGQCFFMNIPYGTTMHSKLRIEPPSNRSINARVTMQVLSHALERKTGRKKFLLVTELDVTESFAKAALMELSAHAEMPLDDIQMVVPGVKAMPKEGQIDWFALTDELQTSCDIKDAVEEAASYLANLTAETCTMQTPTLMSELERLKARHQDFLILRSTGYHENGIMSSVHIPLSSQHLDQLLYDSAPNAIRGEALKAARLLRDRVATAVADG
ncbi:hypothetical protein LTR17_027184 [Elasticomyces elasticus]|nr:hypothetical protein LTR17_027184 [Elasticomyces elasticus]